MPTLSLRREGQVSLGNLSWGNLGRSTAWFKNPSADKGKQVGVSRAGVHVWAHYFYKGLEGEYFRLCGLQD